jgi:hypothetical protein
MVALTWAKARSILRELLVEYLEGPFPQVVTKPAITPTNDRQATLFSKCTDWWLQNDLDLYCGALSLSFGLLILACLAWVSSVKEGNTMLNAAADHRVYLSQLSAAVLLAFTSMASVWMVRRRQFACTSDVDSVKRREIKRFLKSMEWQDVEDTKEDSDNGNIRNCASAPNVKFESIKLPGTSLTDIYPVYRLSSEGGQGSWSRLPTLLLVKGDYVALQVGDLAPSKCALVSETGTSTNDNIQFIGGGERITLESFGGGKPTAALPKGRTTLPTGSSKLLELCNSLRVFVLLESPLYSFLRLSVGTLVNLWSLIAWLLLSRIITEHPANVCRLAVLCAVVLCSGTQTASGIEAAASDSRVSFPSSTASFYGNDSHYAPAT